MTSRSVRSFGFLLILALSLIGCQPTTYTPAYNPPVQQVVIPAPTDPCANMYFNESACSTALMAGGYWHYGQFMAYQPGYSRNVYYYRDNYSGWVRQGNRPIIINYNQPEYTRTYQRQTPSTRSNTVTRDTGTGTFQTPATTPTFSTSVVSGSGSQRSNTVTQPRTVVQSPPSMVSVPTQRSNTVTPVQAAPAQSRYSSFQAPATRQSSTVTRSSQSSGLTNNTSVSSGRSSTPTASRTTSSSSSTSSSSRSSSGPTRR